MLFLLSITATQHLTWPIDTRPLPTYFEGRTEGDYVVGPPYHNAPELTPDAKAPKGSIYRFVMDSGDSRIYPGIAKNKVGVVPYNRRVSVYVPSGAVASRPLPFFVSQDSMAASTLPVMLDNMIAAHRLPSMVGIFIDSGGGDAQGSERGLEYDTMSGRYAEFVESEVLPRVSRECNVTLTGDPNGRMTMGGSSGGAAALSMAWFHPDLYGRVLSYSGTFVNQQSPFDPASPRGAWEYHASLIPSTPRRPLRIWLEVGENDIRSTDPESTFHNWVMANVRMAQVLRAKRYRYQFVYARGAGHVDRIAVNQTLPAAFEYVWRAYRPGPAH